MWKIQRPLLGKGLGAICEATVPPAASLACYHPQWIETQGKSTGNRFSHDIQSSPVKNSLFYQSIDAPDITNVRSKTHSSRKNGQENCQPKPTGSPCSQEGSIGSGWETPSSKLICWYVILHGLWFYLVYGRISFYNLWKDRGESCQNNMLKLVSQFRDYDYI